MAAKRALVTGGNGFLGLNLIERLSGAGWQVFGLCQPGTELRHIERLGANTLVADLLDLHALVACFPKGLDAVFHTAALTSLWSRRNALQTRVNVEGTRNVCRLCVESGAARLVHTSTWNTFGLGRTEISEAMPQFGAESWVNYVRSKTLAEAEVRKAISQGLTAVILNPAHMIGRYDTRNWARMFRMVCKGALRVVPNVMGSFCHAGAVADAHLAAIERGRPSENYLLPGVEASFPEVVGRIARLAGVPAPQRTIPPALFKLVGRASAWGSSLTGREPRITPENVAIVLNHPRVASDKAERELGYRRVPLDVMLEDAYRWLEAEHLLE